MASYIIDSCPICENTAYFTIGPCDSGDVNIENKPKKSVIAKCKECNSIYVNPMPIWSEKDFNALYNSAEEYFHPTDAWQSIRKKDIVERRFRCIGKHIRTKNKNSLEIGAGIQAYMAKYVAMKGWEVTVQEPSTAFFEILKEENPSFKIVNTEFLRMNSSSKYALIYIDSVLEHVPNPHEYLKKSFDLLEEGGILYFISPIEHSFKNWFKTTILRQRPVPYICPYTLSFHVIGFSKKSIRILAKKSGLKLVKHIRRYDYDWLHILNRKESILKYPVAIFFYFIDLFGWGCNQEILLRKEKQTKLSLNN